MRRERARSPSRRQTGREPRDWISSTRPSVRSLATTLPAAPPGRFDVALRSGCQQPQLGIGQFHGILHSVATAIGAATTEAPQWPGGRRGRIPEGLFAPGTVTVPLRSRRNASSFWIILLLVSG